LAFAVVKGSDQIHRLVITIEHHLLIR